MNRTSVTSSFIESIGYEDGILEVAYKDGRVYKYTGVPSGLYESVMGAESIGKVFREHILRGGFEVDKVEAEVIENE